MTIPQHHFIFRVAYARNNKGFAARVKVLRTDLGPKPVLCGQHMAWDETFTDAMDSALQRAGERLRADAYDSREGVVFRPVATVETVGKVSNIVLDTLSF
jgi:ABC-type branched-subunit amino acid transport system substrate-binding protein